MYWNLNARIGCGHCHHEFDDSLQTHYLGEAGSCVNYYDLHEPVEELHGTSVLLDGSQDDLCAICPNCKAFLLFGAEIVSGCVERIFPIHTAEHPYAMVPEPNEREILVESYLKRPFTYLVRPTQEGGFVGEIPELPGCMSQGATWNQVYLMLRRAMRAWIEAAIDDGEAIPMPNPD